MLKKIFLIIVILFTTVSNSFAIDKIYNHLRLGKNALETHDNQRAVEEFSKYLEGSDMLVDYALFWRAKSYNELNKTEEAINDIKIIKTTYNSSPILPFALKFEIEIQTNHTKTLELCKDYLNIYPKSSAIRLLYAETFIKMGNATDAKKQYKKLYLNGETLSKNIMRQYNFQNLGTTSQLSRAESLIKAFKHGEAELLMRENIDRASGDELKKIYYQLGYALFLQKQYRSAAEYFMEAGDIYYETFSLYRADSDRYKKRIEQNIETLVQKGDPKADELLLKMGQQAKNDGKYDEAIRILLSIKKDPSLNEDVLWYTGWSYYLNGDFDKAYTIFNNLQEKYQDPKYLYWMARCLQQSGKDAMPIYRKIKSENNYYTLLSLYRNNKIPKIVEPSPPIKEEIISKELQRLNILIILKLDPAISIEAGHILKTLGRENANLVAEAACLLDSTGLHYKAASLTDRIPYKEGLHRIYYPIVFKEDIDSASNMYSISPNLIFAIMREESRFNDTAMSPVGAIGLMQLMPTTARKIALKCGISIRDDDEILAVHNNINLGAKYLKILVDDFNSLPPAIASYNAGRVIVKSWLNRGNYKSADEFIEDIPYAETRNYVKRVLRSYFQYLRYNNTNLDEQLKDINIVKGDYSHQVSSPLKESQNQD